VRSTGWPFAPFLPINFLSINAPDAGARRKLTSIQESWAQNFRSLKHRGEIDLIGWDKDILCFIEVKTRTSRDVKPPEAAVDRHKRREIVVMVRAYLRQVEPACQWRFDIVSVYYESPKGRQPRIEVFRNASLSV
jgi:Holliday junction resolvase-like predicted endonuclease